MSRRNHHQIILLFSQEGDINDKKKSTNEGKSLRIHLKRNSAKNLTTNNNSNHNNNNKNENNNKKENNNINKDDGSNTSDSEINVSKENNSKKDGSNNEKTDDDISNSNKADGGIEEEHNSAQSDGSGFDKLENCDYEEDEEIGSEDFSCNARDIMNQN